MEGNGGESAEWPNRWAHLDAILERAGRPLAPPDFLPSPEVSQNYSSARTSVSLLIAIDMTTYRYGVRSFSSKPV